MRAICEFFNDTTLSNVRTHFPKGDCEQGVILFYFVFFFSSRLSRSLVRNCFDWVSRICLLVLKPFLKLLPAVGHTTFPRDALKCQLGQSKLADLCITKKKDYTYEGVSSSGNSSSEVSPRSSSSLGSESSTISAITSVGDALELAVSMVVSMDPICKTLIFRVG